MDVHLRILIFVVAGLVLLTANLWFLRATTRTFFSNEFVIRDFSVIDPTGSLPDGAGQAVAQMAVVQLLQIQALLVDAGAAAAVRAQPSVESGRFGATSLFVTRPVEIPTGLFKPVDIKVSVGGVEVGGLLSYLQSLIGEEQAILFTIHNVSNRSVLSADFGAFAPEIAPLWFKTDTKDLGEIATFAAYALLHARLARDRTGPLSYLDLPEFRTLIETITGIDAANRKIGQGVAAEDSLAKYLTSLDGLATKVPDWHELHFMIASTSESLGQTGKAILHYRKLTSASANRRKAGNTSMYTEADTRLATLGGAQVGADDESQAELVMAASEFARRMNLKGTDPDIVFLPGKIPGQLGQWDPVAKHYVVYEAGMTFKGMPQYVALMGRFFTMHMPRCFPEGSAVAVDSNFWNEFRYAVVDYLIQSHADFIGFESIGAKFPMYAGLKKVEERAGLKAAQRLGLALLERFDCAWTYGTMPSAGEALSVELQLARPGVIANALNDAGVAAAQSGGP
jgi:hypothetical protein